MAGALGRSALVERGLLPANTNQAIAFIRLRPDSQLDRRYLIQYLRGEQVRRYIKTINVQSAQANLSLENIRDIQVPYPEMIEQRAIAHALSDTDRLIVALGELIAKKRAMWHGLKQQLLSGRSRIPGFDRVRGYRPTEAGLIPNDWEAIRLGDLFTFKNGLNKGKEYFGAGTPIINYLDVFRRPWLRASELRGRVTLSKVEVRKFAVEKGDVFFTRTSETAVDVGVASVMADESPDTVFSGFLLRARPIDDSLDDNFKRYCFGTALVRRQIVSTSTETTRALTNGGLLSAVWIAQPPRPEQTAIAAALSDADSEIITLEQKYQKIRAVKQGAMQSLLTGRVRLIEPAEAPSISTASSRARAGS
jgi:type I restriction enzyme S subunit